jgi:hypothetical protein
MGEAIPSKLCGRPFSGADLETIRGKILTANPPLRSEIARQVCQTLEWTDVLGRPKLMSARVGLLRLHRAGLIELPAPTRGNGNGRRLVHGPDAARAHVARRRPHRPARHRDRSTRRGSASRLGAGNQPPCRDPAAGARKSLLYLCRWQIEVSFKVLKSGCRIEQLQLERRERLEPALAFYLTIAWRVLYLPMLGRDCPEMPCNTVFAEEEWKAVYLVTQRQSPPEQPPSLDTMVRMVATLGGFLNRKSDGFPRPKTLWIGLQRAPDFVLALEAQRSIGESCG